MSELAGPSAAPAGEPPVFDPFAPGFAEDPYPTYAAMRQGDPVHRSPLGMWAVFGYDDVQRFLRDPEASVEAQNAHPTLLDEVAAEAGVGDQRISHAMLDRDPPDHTRLRRLVSKAFTPRMVERLRPRVAELVGQALDAAGRRGRLELMADLAFPLPFHIISELLGMPETDAASVREWSGTLVRALEPVVDPAVLRAIDAAADALTALLQDVVDAKRARPADDLLSALVAAEEQGDVLSNEELVDQVVLLYVAGHETTVNLIGNGVLALLRHPEQADRLRRHPELAPGAVEELLRYDSPVQMTRRITRGEVVVGDRVIEPGAFVVLSLASANRDPARWGPDADRLDLDRAGAGGHVSFGGGHHLCLGAALARLEASVAITALLARFPQLALDGEPVWNGRLNLRGLDRLPLRTGP